MSYLDPAALHTSSYPFQPPATNGYASFGVAAEQAQSSNAAPSSGKAKTKPSVYKESPVKAACLTCRAKKAKCDGVRPICGACEKKSLECQYVKSRRGGARKKREVPPPSALQEFLKKLDGLLGIPDFKVSIGKREPTDDTTNIVREFKSREEIFNCYYNDVHPFLPMMPPRKHLPEILPTLLPVSPFLLAAQTILVLVPHPLDPEPASADSKRLRSAASHAFAAEATRAVERLVETGQTSIECVQALTMLALWEWGSSGSTTKNRARSGHATQLAMELGLHDMDKYADFSHPYAIEGEDWHKDMARRTWWQTYVNQLTSAIVTGTTPIISTDDERVHVLYPVASAEDRAWPQWIETNRQCTRVFNTVNSVYYSHLQPGGGVAAWGSKVENATKDQKQKMRQEVFNVDAEITEMMKKAEETAIIELVPGGEEEVVRNLQLSARLGLAVVHVHIHRHQAFPEVSLFSKMICGLPKMPDAPDTPENPPDTASLEQIQGSGSSTTGPSPQSAEDSNLSPYDFVDDMWHPETYPDALPEPWFTHAGGAGELYAPTHESPRFQPAVAASITSYHSPEGAEANLTERRPSTISISSNKPHKAWGIDSNDRPDDKASPAAPQPSDMTHQLFPPGVSLARCATAAHTIVRLEVLHRSAVIAMWDGPPKWMPFCACGLVTGAYSFLLLALAVQAESLYNKPSEEALEQIDGLLTNVKVIVAGLEAYGTMWDGIGVMASEVRAALEAATQLPFEIRRQLDIAREAERTAALYDQTLPADWSTNFGQYSASGGTDDSMRFTELSSSETYTRELSVEGSVNSAVGGMALPPHASNVYGFSHVGVNLQNGANGYEGSGHGGSARDGAQGRGQQYQTGVNGISGWSA